MSESSELILELVPEEEHLKRNYRMRIRGESIESKPALDPWAHVLCDRDWVNYSVGARKVERIKR